jgi:hypothetical protein
MIYKLLLEKSEEQLRRYPEILVTCKEIYEGAAGILFKQLSARADLYVVKGIQSNILRYCVLGIDSCLRYDGKFKRYYIVPAEPFSSSRSDPDIDGVESLLTRTGTIELGFNCDDAWVATLDRRWRRMFANDWVPRISSWLITKVLEQVSLNRHLHTIRLRFHETLFKEFNGPDFEHLTLELIFEALEGLSQLKSSKADGMMFFEIHLTDMTDFEVDEIKETERARSLIDKLGKNLKISNGP